MAQRPRVRGWCLLGTLAFLVLAALPASAIRMRTDEDRGLVTKQWVDPRYGAEFETADLEAIDGSAAPELQAAWRRLRDAHGESWRARVDRGNGRLRSAAGAGIPFVPGSGNHLTLLDVAPFLGGRSAVDRDVVEAIARDFLQRHGGLFGLGRATLVLADARSGQRGGDSWTLSFDVFLDATPIAGASVEMRVTHGNLVGFGSIRLPPSGATIPESAISADVARAVAWEWIGDFDEARDQLGTANLIVLPVRSAAPEPAFGNGYELAPVWEMRFSRRGERADFRLRIDARSGEVVEFFDQNRYATRQVVGGVFADSYMIGGVLQAEETRPMPFLRVGTNGVPTTNAGGQFDWISGSVSGSLDGPVISIVDDCGGTTLADGGDGVTDQNLDFGASAASDCSSPRGGPGNTRAARMQFHHLNLIKFKARKYGIGLPWTSTTDTTAYVNVPDVCNAFWSPGDAAVIFFQSGGGCGNTGEIAGVSLHEFGHGLDSNDGRSPADNGSGEAYGDLTAAFQTHDSCIGNGFFRGGACGGYGDRCTAGCDGVRDIDWAGHAFAYPHRPTDFGNGVHPYNCPAGGGYNGPCSREGHCESLVTSEAVWDFANRDLVAGVQSPPCSEQGGGTLGGGTLPCVVDDDGPYGLADAWTVADRLWYLTRDNTSSFYSCATEATTDGCDITELFYELKIADDDDGNLGNGTPHAGYLASAFDRHRLGCSSGATGPNVNFRACTPPLAPTLAVAASSAQNLLTWTSSGSGRVYDVWRSDQSCGAGFTRLADDLTALTYTDLELANGFRYFYKVTAHPAGNEACASPASNCVVAEPCTLVGTITLDPIATPADHLLALSWNAIAGADRYDVYRAAAANGPWSRIASPTVATYTDGPLSGQVTYFYYVEAVDDAFVDCATAPSNVRSAVPAGPCTLAPTFAGLASAVSADAALCQVDLDWTPASSACSGSVASITYTVRRATTPGGPYTTVATGLAATSYSDGTDLVSGTWYHYNVRAVDANSSGSESNVVERSVKVRGAEAAILFADDFESETGWSNGPDTADTGFFVREDPVGTAYQPELDHSPSGTLCRFTAQNPNAAAGVNDVDDGEVVTTSPVWSAAGRTTVELELWRWFGNSIVAGAGRDYYVLEVSNGGPWVTLEALSDAESAAGWTQVTFAVEDFVGLTSTMRIRVRAADLEINVIEVAIDDIVVRAFGRCASCPGLPVVTVTPAGPLAVCVGTGVALAATVAGGSGSFAYQWTRDGTPIPGATTAGYLASDVGTHVFNCRVTSSDCAASEFSEDSTPAQITWQAAPSFAGLATVTNPASASCALALAWNPATTVCPGPIAYDIHRSTNSGFTPSAANRIAAGVSASPYVDASSLVSGTTYHYVVRAVDVGLGATDTNTVQRSGAPTGPDVLGTWRAGAEPGDPAMTLEGAWTETAFTYRSGSGAYFSRYPHGSCAALVTPPLRFGSNVAISYYHQYSLEPEWDGARVEISTDGGFIWTPLGPNPAYGSTIVYGGNACGWPVATACYGGTSTGYPVTWQVATIVLGPAYNGKLAQLRWRFATDPAVAGSGVNPGWYVDDIAVAPVMVPGTCTTVAGPNLVVQAVGAFQELSGNGDAIADRGETWSVPISLTNTGASGATGAAAILAGNGVTMCDAEQLFGAIPVGGVASATYAFVISPTFSPCGGAVGFDVVDKIANEAAPAGPDELDRFSLAIGGGAAVETAIQPSAGDATINQNQVTTNYGADPTLLIRNRNLRARQALRRFDLGSLPAGMSVVSATLELFATAGLGDQTLNVHRVDAAWSESGVTWATAPPFAASPIASLATGTASSAWKIWDVTAQVQAWATGAQPNFGLLLKNAVETSDSNIDWTFASKEHGVAAERPLLRVVASSANCSYVGTGTCTLRPAEAASTPTSYLRWTNGTTVDWGDNLEPVSGYHVYRGSSSQLPGLLDSTIDSCLAAAVVASTASVTAVPAAGSFHWYLVLAHSAGGEGPAGNGTAGPRIVNASGNCP